MANGGSVAREPFGKLGGQAVEKVTLSGAGAMRVSLLTYGASIHSVVVPDHEGRLADVALGHATLGEYLDQRQFFGATVGRVANRIAGGRFEMDGREYRLPCNNGPNSLHGGEKGLDGVNWEVAETGVSPASVTFRHVSPDGAEGYPGNLTVTAQYRLEEGGRLVLEYRASTDRPTPVNISNHVYWNLAGEGAPAGAMGHILTLFADHYLPTDKGAIPTGEFRPVDGTPFDFRRPQVIGARVREASDEQIRIGRGYDHAWAGAREMSESPRPLARLEDPASRRVMMLLSNQPSVQFYSGNFLDATSAGKTGRLYRMGDAVALEPQMFPDTPNRPAFGSIRLEPGQLYRNQIVWHFFTA